jgi:hypothetical protein
MLQELTEVTALSKAVEAPPPRDIETMEGRPDDAAEEATKLRPETLNIVRNQSGGLSVIITEDLHISATLPDLIITVKTRTSRNDQNYNYPASLRTLTAMMLALWKVKMSIYAPPPSVICIRRTLATPNWLPAAVPLSFVVSEFNYRLGENALRAVGAMSVSICIPTFNFSIRTQPEGNKPTHIRRRWLPIEHDHQTVTK